MEEPLKYNRRNFPYTEERVSVETLASQKTLLAGSEIQLLLNYCQKWILNADIKTCCLCKKKNSSTLLGLLKYVTCFNNESIKSK